MVVGSAPRPDNRPMPGCDGYVALRRARPDDAAGIAQVHVGTWRSAYSGLMPAPFLAGLTTETRERFWRDEIGKLPPDRRPWVAQLDTSAEDGKEIVGFEHSGPARDEDAPAKAGEVYLIYVVEECWSRGLGRDLLAHGERDLTS